MSTRTYPAQRGANLLFVFVATFIAMFLFGSFLFQHQNSPPSEPIPQLHTKNSIKIFLVMVDDLNSPDPQIDSLWTLSIDTNLNEIHFLEMTYHKNWDDLAETFSIEPGLELSPEFINKAKTIVENPEGYILLDRFGAHAILSAQISDNNTNNASSKINSAQMETFCESLNNPEFTRPIRLGNLMETQHLSVELDTQHSVQLLDTFVLPQEQRSCFIKSASTK